ncbi:hypothetical protein SLA2020_242980 [Shorea laevis]
MSSVGRLLHNAFSPASQSASSVSALFRESNLESLVQRFKKLCEHQKYRDKIDIYDHTVRRLASAGRFDLVEEVIEDQRKYICVSKEGFAARLIRLCGKSGMFDHAQKVFDEMPIKGVLSFNALMGACVNSNKFDEVNRLFKELPEKLSIKPDRISYNTVIKAFCEMGSFDSASLMLDEMEKKGMEPDEFTFNTLLDAFYKNGKFVDGEKIWNIMLQKNVTPTIRSYNAKLHGLVSQKRTEEAVKLVGEIRSKGFKPDVFSFNALFESFISEGNLEEARRWYNEMKKNGCAPDKVTFELLVPFASEKGDVDFAFEQCEKIFGTRFSKKFCFDESLLQKVVDELVACSKIEEAKKLVQLGKANKYHDYRLKLPSK